ncbi:nucleotide-binding protein [Aquincola sp. S2]|uniref:Nucleotide-binding protein n=2 Tax=Pseudaquabacterium terrae TaxID=2732868 RepID=A0ABX2ET60_9BURK|nr:nucleotide-binding protein [Aquabacterium terrae]
MRGFDVANLKGRKDNDIEALAKKVDATLQDVFGHGTVEFSRYQVGSFDTMGLYWGEGPDIASIRTAFKHELDRSATNLSGLVDLFEERLEEHAAQPAAPNSTAPAPCAPTRRAFVVHGHDDGMKQAVARFVEGIDLVPVILHEQPSEGKTVIEKVPRRFVWIQG